MLRSSMSTEPQPDEQVLKTRLAKMQRGLEQAGGTLPPPRCHSRGEWKQENERAIER